jgi:hypothetical protein
MKTKKCIFLILLIHNNGYEYTQAFFCRRPEITHTRNTFGRRRHPLKQSLLPLFSSQSDNDDFLDRLAEVEEAGGDPFFLQDGNEEGANDPDDGFIENPGHDEEIIAQIEAVGGDPFFLSHDVEDDSLADINPSDAVTDEGLPAESTMMMMMMAMSAGGGDVMDLIEKSNESQDPPSSSVAFDKEQEPESVSFNDPISEVKAAGGDPFFLSDEKNGDKPEATSTSFEDRMAEIEDMGGDSFFLSDGEAIEPVDSCDEEEEEDPVLFSEAFMAFAMSAGGGGVINLIGEENQEPPTFPSIKTAEENDSSDDDRISEIKAEGGDHGDKPEATSTSFEDRMAEIEDMGGDSFFLSDGEAIEPVNSCDEEEEEDPVLFSEAFMAFAMSAGGGGVINLIGEENQDPPTFPSIKTAEENDSSDDDRISEIKAEGGDPSFLSGDEKGGRDGDLDQMAEIEAIGGDAFFLSEHDSVENATDIVVVPSELVTRMAMSGDGILDMIGIGAEKASTEEDHDEDDWEWDGLVDEEAHLGFD